MQALYEDGLPAVSDGACPFYSFESIDTLHYYITNGAYGTNTKYLCESTKGTLAYMTADAGQVLEDEAFAWKVLYDKMTGLYFIRNLKSGKYFRHTGSSVALAESQPSTKEAIQLMPARITMDFTVGETTITKKPYWFARGDRKETPNVIAIDGASKTTVSTPGLDFTNKATKQFWLIYSAEEMKQLWQAKYNYDTNRLRQLVEGSLALVASDHHQLSDGADADFSEKVAAAQALLTDPEATPTTDLQPAIGQLLTDIAAYLALIEANTDEQPLNISFILENPDLQSKTGWTGLSEVTDGTAQFTSKFAMSQKTISLPAGNYALIAYGFQRPGKLTAVNNDFAEGTNSVSSRMMANSASKYIQHIAESGRTEKLNQGGTEQQVKGIYQPTNAVAAAAYFRNGYYENRMPFTLEKSGILIVKLQNTKTIANDWTVCGGFQLLYYGASMTSDGIEQMKNEELRMKNGADAMYDLSGRQLKISGLEELQNLPPGVYIIDGRKVIVN